MKAQETRVELHSHSDYSNTRLIDCINKISSIIKRSVELGYSGVAITDHESVSGHVKALQEVKKGKENGSVPKDFKLILGNEIYLVNSLDEIKNNYQPGITKFWHFILLAKDEEGHRQLRELSSLAWDNSFYTGKMERVPTLKSDLKRIVKANPGHLIACSACLGGELPCHILERNVDKINEFLEYCVEVFGIENFFLELQPNDSEDQIFVNKTLIRIAEQTGLNFVITCDAHYLKKEDRIFHEAYLKSHEEEREVGDFYKTTYLMSVDEIHEYLDPQIGKENVSIGLKNSVEIGNKIEEYDLAHPVIVPEAEIPEFEIGDLFKEYYKDCPYIEKFSKSNSVFDRYLLCLIEKGFIGKKQDEGKQEEIRKRVERIEIELSEMWKVTEKINTSISSYYLTTLELIEIMWNEGDSLVGVARGSVTGMYTMYLIDLIQMNPMKWNLPHWRHISWQKAELSDLKKSLYVVTHIEKCGEPKKLGCA